MVSNTSAKLFPVNALSSFTVSFAGATECGGAFACCKFRIMLPINVPKCPRGKKCLLIKKIPKSSDFYYVEPGPYPSLADIVEAMKALIQQRHNHGETSIAVIASQRT